MAARDTGATAQLYGSLISRMSAAVDALDVADNILSGGVQVLQLRAKNQAPETILPLARELSALCRESGIPFIVNDHPRFGAGVPCAGGARRPGRPERRRGAETCRRRCDHRKVHPQLGAGACRAAGETGLHRLRPLVCYSYEARLHAIGIDDIRRLQDGYLTGLLHRGNQSRQPSRSRGGRCASSGHRFRNPASDNPQAYCQECRHILNSANARKFRTTQRRRRHRVVHAYWFCGTHPRATRRTDTPDRAGLTSTTSTPVRLRRRPHPRLQPPFPSPQSACG